MLVNRDPFARTELHKQSVTIENHSDDCAWCGRLPATDKGRNYLFAFRTESDGGRVSRHPKLFCSVACFRDYNGE